MDKKIIIANWKSHKSRDEAKFFLEKLSENISKINLENKQIIIAPPLNLLEVSRHVIDELRIPISLSAQNVSPYPEGAYTGEVAARQVKEYADFVIVGHSERREYFGESDDMLEKKVNESRQVEVNIIYCVQDESQKIPEGVFSVAYEPPSAIGSGNPDDPSNIERVFSVIKERFSGRVLYGGSINEGNVVDYVTINSCDGLLIGGASLEVNSFISLLSQW